MTLLHTAFYRFVALADPAAVAVLVRDVARRLQGSVVVAPEGISGTLAGDATVVAEVEAAMRAIEPFAGMRFQHSACRLQPFGRLKVSVRPELVALGLPAGGLPTPDGADASHLSPAAWRELLAHADPVLLDNRNQFEFRLGRFRGARDPGVDNFRDVVGFVEAEAPSWRAAGRPVAMYCTGGIRCDKTAPWLRSLGLDVVQLDGGILNYLAEVEDPVEWEGECFVFDKRITLDARLQPTATTAEQVFDASRPDEAWRLQRALRLGYPPPGGEGVKPMK